MYECDVFVTNVPSLKDIPHHTFMKWFKQYGKVVKYKIKHNKSTAVISYDNPESANEAITHLNESYTSLIGQNMFVSQRHTTEYYDVYQLLKDKRWQEAYEKFTDVYLDGSTIYNTIIWKTINKYYELIACQHFELFNLINKKIEFHTRDNMYHIPDSVLVLQVRKEGWFARKSAVNKVLKEYSPLSDDVIDHIVIGYCM